MAQYTPTYVPSRPLQDSDGGVQGAPDFVTRNYNTGYEWNEGVSLPHQMVDNNWIALDDMAQSGQSWPLYTGLYLKNRGLDTESGIFVDNPYNNNGASRFGVNYVNYRLDELDSSSPADYGVTLAEGDFLSHNGNLNLKNGNVRYGTTLGFVDSDTSISAMSLSGANLYVGAGSTTNPQNHQVRIGKDGGTSVAIGSLNNVLNQEVTLQLGAAGSTSETINSGSIKAKQTQLSPPLWNLTLNSYNGTSNVEAVTIEPDGQVTIPNLVGAGPDYDSAKIVNLTSPGVVQLGTYAGGQGGSAAPSAGTTTVWGNLDIRGNITFPGSGTGVDTVNLAPVGSTAGLVLSQNQNSGVVNLNVAVDALNEIPLVTEVTSWNNLIGTAGGAAKADQLTTSRLLWGQAFNGTADVSGALTNVTSVNAGANDLALTSNSSVRFISAVGAYRFKNTSNFYGNLGYNALTADRVFSMPNASGTVALTSDITNVFTNGLISDSLTCRTNAQLVLNAGESSTYATGQNSEIIYLNAEGGIQISSSTNNWTGGWANKKTTSIYSAGIVTDGAIVAASVTAGGFIGNATSATTAATATNALKLNNTTATNANSGGKIVQRDGNGSFSAGTISAALNGNATTCTLAGNSYKLEGLVSTNANTGNTIVRRASNGSFSAGTITATLSGSSTSCTGNSATVTNGVYKTGTQTIGGAKTFSSIIVGKTCSSTTVAGANDTGSFSVRGNTTKVAAMTFHRASAYAVNFGLSTANKMELGGYSAASIKHTWDMSGNYTAVGNITAYSDIRLKDNIEVIPDAMAKVKALRGVTFDRNDFIPDAETGVMPETRQAGVIAQEVEKVLPEVVMTNASDGIKTVAYGNMVGLLIEAIKELKSEIDELKDAK